MKKLPPNATTYTAVGLIALGLIMLFVAWNGAAGPENGIDPRAQFPYLLSGGLGGLALIGAGLTLVRVFEARKDNQKLLDSIQRLTDAVERLAIVEEPMPELTDVNGQYPAHTVPAMPPAQVPFESAQ